MLVAAPASVGAWVDASVPLTPAVLASVRSLNKRGVARYVPLPHNDTRQDISAAELGAICGAGLDCLLVQHVRAAAPGSPGWYPGKHDGGDDARAAADWAASVGYPADCHVCLDLEDIAGTAAETRAFAAAWSAHMLSRGYRAMLYVGYAVPLDAEELYDLPGFTSYWSDFGTRHVATRGFAITQHAPEIVIAGTRFDSDIVAPDLLGDLPVVCRAA